MGTSAGNMQAQKNGRAVEELLLGKQVSSHHVLDSPKLEVKTVQEKVKYKGNTSGWRWGSFVLYHHQHKELLENAGSYLFNVLDAEGNIMKQRIISGQKIEKEFKVLGRKQVTLLYPTVFALRVSRSEKKSDWGIK